MSESDTKSKDLLIRLSIKKTSSMNEFLKGANKLLEKTIKNAKDLD